MSTELRSKSSPVRRVPAKRPGPVGGRRDENRRQRTRAICEAALRLFLKRGIEPVTIDEIAHEAGVAKGSFYRYFSDKADLVDALLQPSAERVREAFDACDALVRSARNEAELFAAYQGLASGLAQALTTEPDVVRLYLQESRVPGVGARKPVAALGDEITRRAVALTEVARGHGLVCQVDARISGAAIVGAVEHLLFRFLSGEDLGPVDQVPEALLALILYGLRPNSHP